MPLRPSRIYLRDSGRHYGFGALTMKNREKIFEDEKGRNCQTCHQYNPFFNSHTVESILQMQEIQIQSSVKKTS
jgi:hypothetical protein